MGHIIIPTLKPILYMSSLPCTSYCSAGHNLHKYCMSHLKRINSTVNYIKQNISSAHDT